MDRVVWLVARRVLVIAVACAGLVLAVPSHGSPTPVGERRGPTGDRTDRDDPPHVGPTLEASDERIRPTR